MLEKTSIKLVPVLKCLITKMAHEQQTPNNNESKPI
jgi:hypothetical protein